MFTACSKRNFLSVWSPDKHIAAVDDNGDKETTVRIFIVSCTASPN